jgi:hypothetical protein
MAVIRGSLARLTAVLGLILGSTHISHAFQAPFAHVVPTEAPEIPNPAENVVVTAHPPMPTRGMELVRRALPPTLANVDAYTHLGCYQDGSNHILSVTSIFDTGMTPELCRNRCAIEKCHIFGVEDSYYCFCDTSIAGFAVPAPASECTSTCRGQETIICGGSKRMNIYSATAGPIAGGGVSPSTPSSGKAATVTGANSDSGYTANPTTTGRNSNNGNGQGQGSGGNGQDSGSNSGMISLSIGAVVGIAVGSAAAAGVFVALIAFIFCCRRRRDSSTPPTQYTALPTMQQQQQQPQQHQQMPYTPAAPPAMHEQVYDSPNTHLGGYVKPDYGRVPSYTNSSPVGAQGTPPIPTTSPAPPEARTHEMHAPLSYEMPVSYHPR